MIESADPGFRSGMLDSKLLNKNQLVVVELNYDFRLFTLQQWSFLILSVSVPVHPDSCLMIFHISS